MFGLVRKKTIEKLALDIYMENDHKKPGERDFYFSCGSASALGCLCSRIGIDLSKAVKRRKEALK